MNARIFASVVLFLTFPTAVQAQEGPEAAFRQWQSAYEAAAARVSDSGTLREALNESARDRHRMQELAQTCQSRLSELESAAFKLRFLKGGQESAQRDADRLGAAKDQRYEEMMARAEAEADQRDADLIAREEAFQARMIAHDAERQRLHEWDERQEIWRAELAAWFARVDAMSKEEGPAYDAYVAAFYEYKAEEERFNADVRAYNAAATAWTSLEEELVAETLQLAEDSVLSEDTWIAKIEEINAFMLEEGKPALEAQELASKKEIEYLEAAEKFAALEQEQADEMEELESLLGAANALLEVVSEALNAPPPSTFAPIVFAAEPYAPRSEETAQAVTLTLPPTSNAPALQSRIMVLPPSTQVEDPVAASAERIRTQLQAEALLGQYTAVTKVKAEPVSVPAAKEVDDAPATFIGPAPLSYAGEYDDGSAAIVLTDEMLNRFFDPGIYVSDLEYQRARASQDRCAALVPKLEAEIERLRQQRDKTAGYSTEFEAVRAEIAAGALRDALGTYSAAFKYARTSGKLAKLSAEQSEQIERAFDLMKLGLAPAHANLTKDEAEKRNVQFKTLEDGATMLTSILAASSGNKDVEAVLDGAGNLMKSYCEVVRYRESPVSAAQPAWEKIGARVKLDIEIAANFVPLVAVGVAIEGTGERAAHWLITREAVNSLSASLTSNDEAIIYLADQLTRRQLELDKAESTVRSYEGVDPSRRRAFHIRAPQ